MFRSYGSDEITYFVYFYNRACPCANSTYTMKNSFFFLLCLAYPMLTFAQTTYVPSHLIVKIKENVSLAALDLAKARLGVASVDNLAGRADVARIRSIGHPEKTHTFLLEFAGSPDVASLQRQFAALPEVVFAEPDYLAEGGGQCGDATFTPNDNSYYLQWGFHNNGSLSGIGNVVAGADVSMEAAWDIETGDPSMIIAIPDSGLRMTHPDIAARLWVNPNEILNGIDDDNNGFVDDRLGWDFVADSNDPTDDLGHGTNIAGIIGAVANNNSLFTGANWNSKLMILKVLDSNNSSTYANMAASIYYAVDNGAKVISMSIGGTGASAALSEALQYAAAYDVLFLACMMNFNNSVPYYPAKYSQTLPNVMAVGSTNANDRRTAPFFWSSSSGSNYGTHLSVVAPGNYIYGLSAYSDTDNSTYWGGTSQATPLVAAIASLLFSHDTSLSASDVRSILEDTADDQVGLPSEDTAGFDIYMGHGRVNAYAALQYLSMKGFSDSRGLSVINPVRGSVLTVNNKDVLEGVYQYRILDLNGREIADSPFKLALGTNEIALPELTAGHYIGIIQRGAYRKVFRLVKGG